MFDPNNSQQTARFGVNPFQRIEIPLGPNIDRSQGEYFPAPQGTGFYVERCDYPVLVSLVNKADSVGQAHVLRDGMQIEGDFKGFYIVHPTMNSPLTLSIVTYAGRDVSVSNELAKPVARLTPSSRVTVNTGLSYQGFIYVPPGVRALCGLQVRFDATTLTDAFIGALDQQISPVFAPSNLQQQMAGSIVVYNIAGQCLAGPSTIVLTGTKYTLSFPDLVLPVVVREVQIGITGTGMANFAFNASWQ